MKKHCRTPFQYFSALRLIVSTLFLVSSVFTMTGQAQENRIARQIASQESVYKSLTAITPLLPSAGRNDIISTADKAVKDADFYSIQTGFLSDVLVHSPEYLLIEFPFQGNSTLRIRLKRADIFTSTFQVFTSSDPATPFPYEKGQYYWGVIEGMSSSLVALSFTRDEIMGFIQTEDKHYTLGKLENDETHILYATDNLEADPGINCYTDETHDMSSKGSDHGGSRIGPTNCVKMYIQVDYDIFLNKGGVQQAADYVNGAFSQVSILYANEEIELVVNELFVWNTADPFNGPTTSNYLSQFRTYLNGNYNGDLAHLVGLNGGGGIAYLDVLCNNYSGVGYSAVNTTYNNVPTYSWTVMVLTHEIGHNLGSPHTHACSWNGNNTAIDGCGPSAGYSEGCNGPIPPSGTIMSYCHLIGGVGINFNNGFGPQPGDRIRNRVYNASCLETCGPATQYDAGIIDIDAPIAFPCESTTSPVVVLQNFGATPLTNVTIQYKLDNGTIQTFAWSGSLGQGQTIPVTLPQISYGAGTHTFQANTLNPNGQPDEVTSNDQSVTSFTYIIDWCICNESTATLSPNPLTHSGPGSSSASVSFAPDSKHPSFSITNINAKINGPSNSRFVEKVIVSYVDGNGANHTYGTFYGNQQSTVNVSIEGFVSSISVSLTNNLNNNYGGTLSVSFTAVNYCAPSGGCNDADDDGVCDEVDVCPGFDDNLIGTACDDGNACTENDVYTIACICAGTVIPGCPGEGCDESISNFSPNPLTHAGSGQSTSLANLPLNNGDASFVISGLDARTSGNPGKRYIEQVAVSYVNGNGNVIQYGVFRGDQVNTVNVDIAGSVQSVSVVLTDAYDGNSSEVMSVAMSPVTSCNQGGAIINQSGPGNPEDVTIYPNPTSGDVFIRWDKAPHLASVNVYNALGKLIGSYTFTEVSVARLSLGSLGISGNQLLFISIKADGELQNMKHVMMN